MFRLPNINHPTDSGKIQQISDFLFQFIRQLNMEQEKPTTTTGEDIEPVDYVVEQGTSGGWTYRKWASGKAECWCEYTNPKTTFTGGWGALFIGKINPSPIEYPFSFAERPKEIVQVRGDKRSVMLYTNSTGGVNTSTHTAIYCGTRPVKEEEESAFTLDIYVMGRWK